MEINESHRNRFQELISFEDAIMQTREFGGGEPSRRVATSSGTKFFRETMRYDKVDSELAIQWGMKCLSLLKIIFGENGDYYIEFKKLSASFRSSVNYSKVKSAFSVLRAANNDYEEGYHTQNISEILSDNQNYKEINNLKKKCAEEAKRNTRFYSIIIFVILAIPISCFFYFSGINLSFVTFILLIVSYFLSTIFLKEWTLSKLQERLLEHERNRLYKRFGVDKD